MADAKTQQKKAKKSFDKWNKGKDRPKQSDKRKIKNRNKTNNIKNSKNANEREQTEEIEKKYIKKILEKGFLCKKKAKTWFEKGDTKN